MSLFEQKSLLAKLMATENLIIQQDNVSTASFDILNRILTVPILDRKLSKELYDLFMGHECGHALWTPLEGMKKAKADGVNMSVLNVVEDSRIERKIKNKYPGIKAPFIKAYSELYEKNFFETEEKDINEFNLIDRINLHCKIGAALALPFSDEERKLLDEVESTETFEDAVEVAKKICSEMKEQLEEMQQAEKKKVKIVVHGTGEGDSASNEPSEGEENDDADVTIHVNGEDSDGEGNSEGEEPQNSDEGKESNEKSKSSSTGQGAGRHIVIDESVIRSFTDDAYKKNEHNLFDKGKNVYVYANIPTYDTNQIMDYKVMLKLMKEEGYVVDTKMFNQYRHESAKVVSYLVKEFELRKNADQMKRAATAKTGDLNMNRLYSYNFTEDIFKKITVMPQGKSHGLVMFLDWSGSMTKHFANTVKQLLNLVMFCKKVNIPFEVYCFIDGTVYEYNYKQQAKLGDLDINNFGLINLLSNRMSARDFTYAASALMKMSGCGLVGRWGVRPPSFMYMSGTPLNEAVIAAMEIVPQFQKKNRLQIVNTVFLTDGEGSSLNKTFEKYDNGIYSFAKSFTHMVIRDPKTRHEELYSRNGGFWSSSAMLQTDCFVRLLKARTNSHVIGFFIGETKDIANRSEYFWPEEHKKDVYGIRERMKEKFKKESSLVITSTGFDDYYVLRSNGLDTDDEEELTFKENATTRGMVSAFSKYTGGKIASRVVLNRFIGLIS